MLLNLDALPAGMELFPATNDDAWTLIQRVIDESDYYLLVIGGRYGSIDDETNLSYTEKEFDYAVSQGKPVMAFLHSNPEKIPSGKTDQNDSSRAKLDAFRAKVQGAVHVNYWAGSGELAGHVAKSFVKLQKTHPAVGWVRGDVQTSTQSLEELNDLRKRLDEAETKLTAVRNGPPTGIEALSQGTDKLKLPVSVQFTVTDQAFRERGWSEEIDVETDWNGIFGAIGTSLLDEANQDDLRKRLESWAASHAYAEAVERKDAWLAEQDFVAQLDNYRKAVISGDDFDTIILQLRALGLIVMSDRKRSLKDVGTYWTLTPYGDEQLVALRALRRSESVATEQEQPSETSEPNESEG